MVLRSRVFVLSLSGYSQWSNVGREELLNDVERLNYLQGYVTHLSRAIRHGDDLDLHPRHDNS
jgi:beta-glucosidase